MSYDLYMFRLELEERMIKWSLRFLYVILLMNPEECGTMYSHVLSRLSKVVNFFIEKLQVN